MVVPSDRVGICMELEAVKEKRPAFLSFHSTSTFTEDILQSDPQVLSYCITTNIPLLHKEKKIEHLKGSVRETVISIVVA